jgi:uncharacterized membrane protein YczE
VSEKKNPLLEFLRPHRTIPKARWTAKSRWDLNPSRVLILVVALFFFGLGDALLIQSHTGNAPWSVFAQGLSRHTGLDLGLCTFIISGFILMLWWPLGERPGFGTLANMVVIAIGIQVGADTFTVPKNFGIGLLYDFIGIAFVGIASAFYITCGLGPGPRDGLMTSLHKKTGIRVSRIRLMIEGGALFFGWLLGGRIGIGTALFALLIGQSVAISLGAVAKLNHSLQ